MPESPDNHQDLLPGGSDDGDGEGWLVSYLDVMTLLVVLFVLMLALAENGIGNHDARGGQALDDQARQTAMVVAAAQGSGISPRNSGLLPQLEGLMPEGISVSRGTAGVTLRIDDNLLFASGMANLTNEGRQLLGGLLDTLRAFEGSISVEGHTDNVPIATARFPSNWELSGARAIAVLRYLQQQDIPGERLRAIGYADTQPLADNDSVEGRAANRRVELVLHERPDQLARANQ